MEDMIKEIQVQIEFYSDRFEIYGRKDDKARLGYYINWLKEIQDNSEKDSSRG
jgi:hypothetical protein